MAKYLSISEYNLNRIKTHHKDPSELQPFWLTIRLTVTRVAVMKAIYTKAYVWLGKGSVQKRLCHVTAFLIR